MDADMHAAQRLSDFSVPVVVFLLLYTSLVVSE